MLHAIKKTALRAGGVLAVLALAACGSLSHVSDQGTTDEPVWPDPADVTFPTGSYPNVDSLRLVGDGMTKDQLYHLLGQPHFAEGLVGVHEWDYLFHFRTPDGDLTCQYKVLFDKDMLARTFLWKPGSCADVLGGGASAPATFALNSDVLFGFGSATLTPKGEAAVAAVAAKLKARDDAAVKVVGHTDRIGGDAANMALSQRRAQAVRGALIESGVAADRIQAVGVGEREPVVHCADGERAEMVACLAPNRRVEITASGRK